MPDYAADSSYGRIRGSNASFATARSTAAASATSDMNFTGVRNGGGVFQCTRDFLRFDTSGIPDNAVIDSFKITLTISGKNGSRDDDLKVAQYDWSSPITTSDSEYDAALAAAVSEAILWSDVASLVADTPKISGALNTAWVNKSGYTYLVIIADDDITATAPGTSTDSTVNIRTPGDATAGYRPFVTIEWTVPGGSGFWELFDQFDTAASAAIKRILDWLRGLGRRLEPGFAG